MGSSGRREAEDTVEASLKAFKRSVKLPNTVGQTSSDNISYSRTRTFMECPFKHYLRYIKRMKFPYRSDALPFGSAYHSVMEAFNSYTVVSKKDDSHKYFLKEILPGLVEDLTDATLGNAEFTEDVDVEEIHEKFPHDLHDLSSSSVKTIHAWEGPYPRDIDSIEMWIDGRSLQGFNGDVFFLDGKIDLISTTNSIVEYKTAKRRWNADSVAMSWQPDFYLLLLDPTFTTSREVEYIIAVRGYKRGSPIQRFTTRRTMEDTRRLRAVLSEVIPLMIAEKPVMYPVRDMHCRW